MVGFLNFFLNIIASIVSSLTYCMIGDYNYFSIFVGATIVGMIISVTIGFVSILSNAYVSKNK